MKILIVNDYVQCGGTEVQTQREIENFITHNDEILLITFDNGFKTGYINYDHYNFSIGKNVVSRLYNKFFINPLLKIKVKKLIDVFAPDFIRVNNIYACPKLIYKVINKYKVVQTIRDYGAVCPKKTCIKNDYRECLGYKFSNCKECLSGIKGTVRIKYFKKLVKKRKSTVDKFVCPSEALTKKCLENGYNIECVNNPFDFNKSYYQNKIFTSEKNYLYYGAISEIKGVFKLIEAFLTFAENKSNVNLYFIGKLDKLDEKKFFDLINAHTCLKYFGYLKNEDILKMFNSIYCTVVPSLWLENYPNTVLESMANYTLVIGSSRGGIVDMIINPKLLFNILDLNDIKNKLEFTYSISPDEYIAIVKENYSRVKENNALEKYYQNIVKLFKKIES